METKGTFTPHIRKCTSGIESIFLGMDEVLVQVKSIYTVYLFTVLYTIDQTLINMANYQIQYLIFFYFSMTDCK